MSREKCGNCGMFRKEVNRHGICSRCSGKSGAQASLSGSFQDGGSEQEQVQSRRKKTVDEDATVTSMKQAVAYYCSYRGEKPVTVSAENQYRHRGLRFRDGEKIRLMFKREPFRKFGVLFNDRLPEGMQDAEGESIRLCELNQCVDRGVDYIVAVHSDGHIYRLAVHEWDAFRMKYGTIREADDGEKTASVPLRLLERIK